MSDSEGEKVVIEPQSKKKKPSLIIPIPNSIAIQTVTEMEQINKDLEKKNMEKKKLDSIAIQRVKALEQLEKDLEKENMEKKKLVIAIKNDIKQLIILLEKKFGKGKYGKGKYGKEETCYSY